MAAMLDLSWSRSLTLFKYDSSIRFLFMDDMMEIISPFSTLRNFF